jgi:hypothetical protein
LNPPDGLDSTNLANFCTDFGQTVGDKWQGERFLKKGSELTSNSFNSTVLSSLGQTAEIQTARCFLRSK